MIRRRVLRRLIWVCTVCLCPQTGTLGLYELNSTSGKPREHLFSRWSTDFHIVSETPNEKPHRVRDTNRETTSCPRHNRKTTSCPRHQPRNQIMSETSNEKPHHVRDTNRETTSCPRPEPRDHIVSETPTEKPHHVRDTKRERNTNTKDDKRYLPTFV